MTRALTAAFTLSALAVSAQEPIARKSTILLNTVRRGDVHEMVRGLGALKGSGLAELRIAEGYARQIKVGQEAKVDTGKGVVSARVAQLDDSVVDGTARVELRLEADPPPGVRQGKTIDGTIVLSTLKDVLYVGGPTERLSELEGRTDTIFRLEPDGEHAGRVRVEYGLTGRAAGETRFDKVVVLRSGLRAGDSVILTDMSAFKGRDRVRLE